MTNYEKYEAIFEKLQEKLNNEEITMESAEQLNDEAFNKYVLESKKDDVADLLEDLADKVKDGKVTIDDELLDSLKALLPDDKDSDEEKEDNDSDEKKDESEESEDSSDDATEECSDK